MNICNYVCKGMTSSIRRLVHSSNFILGLISGEFFSRFYLFLLDSSNFTDCQLLAVTSTYPDPYSTPSRAILTLASLNKFTQVEKI